MNLCLCLCLCLYLCEAVDECRQQPRICDVNGTCHNTVNNPNSPNSDPVNLCMCVCEAVDECRQQPHICGVNGTCRNTLITLTVLTLTL